MDASSIPLHHRTKAQVDDALAKMQATDDAAAACDAALGIENTTKAASLAQLRGHQELEDALRLGGLRQQGGAAAQRPGGGLRPRDLQAGHHRQDRRGQGGERYQQDGRGRAELHWRLRGTATWHKLAYDSMTPYFDTAPLANPAVPEVREYKAIGVLDDVVSATFAG